eukprot:g5993.t1
MEFANKNRRLQGETNILKHLVVDSGAIIKAERLEHVAEQYWTVQEVIDEIRDSKSKHILNTLPYELKTRVPSSECMNAVIEFSKKTGDFRGLSVPDLKVLALTYMFEKEEVGVDHLRKNPMTIEDMKSAMAKTKNTTEPKDQNNSSEEPQGKVDSDNNASAVVVEQSEDSDKNNSNENNVSDDIANEVTEKVIITKDEAIAIAKDNSSAKEVPTAPKNHTLKVSPIQSKKPYSSKILNAHKTNVVSSLIEDGNFDDTDDLGWVGPDNIDQSEDSGWGVVHRNKNRNNRRHGGSQFNNNSSNAAVLKREVGCVTVDFAMQNVLMQMGLGLYSIRGVAIRKLKQWVLRCLACYHITSKMDKLFCPRCGSDTMTKLSVYVNDQGGLRYGFKKNYRVKTRGTKFAIAKKKGGRKGQGLLLREDQLFTGQWKIAARRKDKMESMFGEDLSQQLGLKEYQNAELTVGFGRRNPNAQRGRERRGKKKKNKNARFF